MLCPTMLMWHCLNFNSENVKFGDFVASLSCWLHSEPLHRTSAQNDKVFYFKLMNDMIHVVVIFTLYFGIKLL